MLTIAVDAMGGDYAPHEIVKGAVLAAKEYDIKIIMVGRENILNHELISVGASVSGRLSIVHADEVIEMNDSPSQAARRKKNSSVHVAMRLVKEKRADAFYSAGNSGAVMAVSKLILRTLKGVDRPAIAVILPNIHGHSVLLDVGANVDCKPIHFFQFAIMGSVYAKAILGVDSPHVGLLSIGEEEEKGNDLIKGVHSMLKELDILNFRGNVEGKALFRGVADVILSDGFTGNIALKSIESTAWYISHLLKEELSKNLLSKIGALFAYSAFKRVRKRVDHTEYGGALLIGINGTTVIGHGSSEANAVKNGICIAKELVEFDANRVIEKELLKSYRSLEIDKHGSFWTNVKNKLKVFKSEDEKDSKDGG